jgi:hypothetical protein
VILSPSAAITLISCKGRQFYQIFNVSVEDVGESYFINKEGKKTTRVPYDSRIQMQSLGIEQEGTTNRGAEIVNGRCWRVVGQLWAGGQYRGSRCPCRQKDNYQDVGPHHEPHCGVRWVGSKNMSKNCRSLAA